MEKKEVKKNRKKKEFYNNNFFLILLSSITILFLLVSLMQVFSLNNVFEKKVEEAKPAEVTLNYILKEDCNDCFDVSLIKSNLGFLNIKEENVYYYNDDRAKKLIENYSISEIPTVIVTFKSDFDEKKVKNINGFEKVKDSFVFKNLQPVFFDLKKNSFIGRVEYTIIEPENCDDCFDSEKIIQALENSNIVFSNKTVLKETEAESIIKKYNIKKLPAIIFSEDLKYYNSEVVKQVLSLSKEYNNKIILENLSPPYKDLSKNEIVGLINATFIQPSNCDSCYNAEEFHTPILTSIGLRFSSVKTVYDNSTEGKELIKKYDIKKLPTVILSSDAEVYPFVSTSWNRVGFRAEDGNYVFTAVEVAKKDYYNVENKTVVKI